MGRLARKKEMLQAAAHVFSRRGFHGATVREIARRTGMLSGSLYAHIRSKEDLLFEIVTRTGQHFIQSVEGAASGDGPASEQLRQALKAHLRVVAGSIDEATVFLHEWKALSPARSEQVRRLREAYEALWDRIIQNGIRSGEFRPADPAFARLLVLSVSSWTYHWFRPDGPLGPDEVAERFADLLLGGLTANGRVAEPAPAPGGVAPQPGEFSCADDGRSGASNEALALGWLAGCGKTRGGLAGERGKRRSPSGGTGWGGHGAAGRSHPGVRPSRAGRRQGRGGRLDARRLPPGTHPAGGHARGQRADGRLAGEGVGAQGAGVASQAGADGQGAG